MGFLLFKIQPLADGRISARRLRPLVLGGTQGLFARHLPHLVNTDDGTWRLSASELLCLDAPDADESLTVFFDLTPGPAGPLNLLQLVEVNGRSASIITDAFFHFKVVATPGTQTESTADSLVLPDWRQGVDRCEQLRLEGGLIGGDWSWTQPPQALSATILKPARTKKV